MNNEYEYEDEYDDTYDSNIDVTDNYEGGLAIK
jgi:hypothetical protein